jgi:nuclear transport factor 2 (NTF2) superfamily protein
MPGRPPHDLRPGEQSLAERLRLQEDAWNLRDLEAVVQSNTIDCQWRNRADFVWGREQIRSFISRRWRRELDARTLTELWAAEGDRVAVRFATEFRSDSGSWFRAYGNEDWECEPSGLVRRRLTCVNEHAIEEHERALRWPAGPRPLDHPTLTELGF